ncbi:MAG TPA: hypothetical protein ENJ09_11280 [Planctomycetes bacterium]|nr:hypothetical protein [Planctomycetota bacterium]
MDAPDEPYRPRESDHLVEPMFAGLGVEAEREEREQAADTPERQSRPHPIARFLRWLTGRTLP